MTEQEIIMLGVAIDSHVRMLLREADAYRKTDNTEAIKECLDEVRRFKALKEATDKLREILSPRKMTWKELRHEYFAAANELRDAMLREYNRHGEQTQVPELWNDLHNLWTKMNTLCGKL